MTEVGLSEDQYVTEPCSESAAVKRSKETAILVCCGLNCAFKPWKNQQCILLYLLLHLHLFM